MSPEQARRELSQAGVPQEHLDELAALAPEFERHRVWDVLLDLLRICPGRAGAVAALGRYLVGHATR